MPSHHGGHNFKNNLMATLKIAPQYYTSRVSCPVNGDPIVAQYRAAQELIER